MNQLNSSNGYISGNAERASQFRAPQRSSARAILRNHCEQPLYQQGFDASLFEGKDDWPLEKLKLG
jgi:hypothetical protein